MSGSLGSLVVSLALDTAKWTGDIGKAAQQLQRIAVDAAKVGAAIGAAMGAGAVATAAMVKQAIDSADAMGKAATAAGIGVEEFSALGYAAELAALNQEQLSAGMIKLAKNMSEAAGGSGDAAAAFKAMGISVKDADGSLKSQTQVLAEVADKMAGYEDGAAKTTLAAQIFGKAVGPQMLPLLNDGAAGIAKLTEEAAKFGLVIGTDVANQAAAFNDNLSRIEAVRQGLVNGIMRELLPTLSNLSTQLVDSAKSSGLLEQAAKSAASGVRILLSVGALIVGVFKTVGERIGGVGAALVALFSGRFQEAFEIYKTSAVDMVENVRGTISTISSIWDETATTTQAQASSTGAKLAAPIVVANTKAKKEVDKLQKMYEQAQKQLEALRDQVDTFGASDKTKDIISFSRVAVTPEQLQSYVALRTQLDDMTQAADRAAKAEEARRQVLNEGLQVQEAVRTAAERYADEMDRLDDLLVQGAISHETWNRASIKLVTDTAAAQQQVYDNLVSGLLSEEEQIQQSYDRRRDAILTATEITETERTDLMARLERDRLTRLAKLEDERNLAILSSGEALFSGLAGLAKASAGKQSAAYRVLFGISKGFAVAEATLKLNQAIINALASGPFPANLAAMASVAAAGGQLVSSISSATYAGAYDKGGTIPAGKWGIAGEFGPEIVEGPARVTSRADTAKMLQAQAPAPQIRIVNAFDDGHIDDWLGSSATERKIVNIVRRNRTAVQAG